jgi:hypothetical protein
MTHGKTSRRRCYGMTGRNVPTDFVDDPIPDMEPYTPSQQEWLAHLAINARTRQEAFLASLPADSPLDQIELELQCFGNGWTE